MQKKSDTQKQADLYKIIPKNLKDSYLCHCPACTERRKALIRNGRRGEGPRIKIEAPVSEGMDIILSSPTSDESIKKWHLDKADPALMTGYRIKKTNSITFDAVERLGDANKIFIYSTLKEY